MKKYLTLLCLFFTVSVSSGPLKKVDILIEEQSEDAISCNLPNKTLISIAEQEMRKNKIEVKENIEGIHLYIKPDMFFLNSLNACVGNVRVSFFAFNESVVNGAGEGKYTGKFELCSLSELMLNPRNQFSYVVLEEVKKMIGMCLSSIEAESKRVK